MLNSTDKKELSLGIVLLAFLVWGWSKAWFEAPVDVNMGEVYRIIFLHVPSAAVALGVAALGLLVSSITALVKPEERFLRSQRAWTEVGLLFTVITLVTGSLWGKPTWGTYWTWDARLTTTLLLALLFIGYLLLYQSLQPGKQRIRACSVFGIIIFVDVPIIYKSVEWWRTLHQPASLIRERGQSMSPEILSVLLFCLAATILFSLYLWWLRLKNLALKDQLEGFSYQQMKG